MKKNSSRPLDSLNGSLTLKPHSEHHRPARSVCVYCGSGHGTNPAYAAAARILGQSLAEAGVGLVYGGGSLGLMGEVARATLDAGGHVTGIIPTFLTEREHMLKDVNDLIVTRDMHERKQLMFDHSAAFVALPGGIGTLEELVEQLTWSQLGRHSKPVILANIADFWSPFLNLLAHMRNETFIRPGLEVRFKVVQEAQQIVPTLLSALELSPSTPNDDAVLAKF
ncbi:MAG: TIGR00730 family Rossman fold protein [Hyphomicrobiales bacterium]|jgi:uncharacterized protein (TIGR00730 family)|nr:MAG: TIGR00730 family Rossman fold protein [Hyphomicrobiales bacterium]